jgi:hypothetical protein
MVLIPREMPQDDYCMLHLLINLTDEGREVLKPEVPWPNFIT